jgi:hypothetical protein
MPDLFLERSFEPGLTVPDVLDMGEKARNCFDLHRVNWRASLLSMDGHRLICRYSAADAESVRIALRHLDADASTLWAGRVYDASGLTDADQLKANVLVERRFEASTVFESIQNVENGVDWCLKAHGVSFLRTFLSIDGKRMICLYRAPDAESVRLVQRQAQLPFEEVWAFRTIRP